MPKNQKELPRHAAWLLRRILPEEELLPLNGSFETLFQHRLQTKGSVAAGLWLWSEILRSLPGFITASLYWRFMMVKNYITMTIRTIRKHTVHSVINLLGLSLGVAVCLLIFLWTQNELSYDRFHDHGENIAQVYSQLEYSSGGSQIHMGSYYPLAKVLRAECPEVLESARYEEETGVLISHGDKKFRNDRIALIDPDFFDIFSFPFIQGSPETAMRENTSVVLTEKMAHKYFGNEDPIGKVLTVNDQLDLLVSGLIDNVPSQSSLQFDCLVPYVVVFAPEFKEPEHWGGNPLSTYVLLHGKSDRSVVENKITSIVEKHMQPETATVTFHLFPLVKKHLYAPHGGGRIQSLLIFSAIAIVVLLIACINFMNLSTAKAAIRAKEVGTRKVIGARKSDLFWQFMGEAVVISLLALLIALAFLAGFLPVFNDLADAQLSLDHLLKPAVLLSFLGIALLTGILSGVYPALYLGSLQPGNILQGTIRTAVKSTLRKTLVVVQFSLSIFLIICTVVVLRQLRFMLSTDLGFHSENLAVVQMSQELQKQFEPLRSDLLNNPQVLGVTRSMQGPWNIGSTVSAVDWDGKPANETFNMHWDYVGYDYFKTMGMNILGGRAFSQKFPTDLKASYIINQTAARIMGMETPVGKRLSVFRQEGEIVGVVQDFHFQPLYHEIKPFVFLLRPDSGSLCFVKIRPENRTDALNHIQSVVSRISPNTLADPVMFNAILTNYIYTSERQTGKIAGYFSLLAVLISCLGLFGLASFMAERRTKEIGIRKVVGASAREMVFMLSRDFTKWVLLSNLFAWPAAYLVSHNFLARYAQRMPFGWEAYILPSLGALIIAVITVSYQTIKAANTNPADSLRYE
jgi:predicted permease